MLMQIDSLFSPVRSNLPTPGQWIVFSQYFWDHPEIISSIWLYTYERSFPDTICSTLKKRVLLFAYVFMFSCFTMKLYGHGKSLTIEHKKILQQKGSESDINNVIALPCGHTVTRGYANNTCHSFYRFSCIDIDSLHSCHTCYQGFSYYD